MKTSLKSFTLVEILIVTTIIGILIGVGAVSYSVLTKNSRDARRKADLEQIRAALELYKSNVGSYPTTGGAWWGACSGYLSKDHTGANGYVPNLAPTYINVLPSDPREGQSFAPCNSTSASCYLYRSNGTDYKVLAHCGAEVTPNSADPYYNPTVAATYSYQVSSSGTSLTW